MIATFREGLSEVRENGEKRFTQSVLHHVLCRLFRSEPIVFHSRFEKAIAGLKPTKLKTDPAPDFWTTYEEVADKHDSELASKYIGDLDITLIFVSVITSPREPFISTRPCCVRRVCFRPSPPPSSSKTFPHSSRIPQISQTSFSSEYCSKIPRLTGPIPWHPSQTSRPASSEHSPSSSSVYLAHYLCLSSRLWGNSGFIVTLESRHGGILPIEERNARQSVWDSRSGDFA